VKVLSQNYLIEDHDESIDVDLTSHPKKNLRKEKSKGDLEFYGTGCASFYTCPIFSIELINPKSF